MFNGDLTGAKRSLSLRVTIPLAYDQTIGELAQSAALNFGNLPPSVAPPDCSVTVLGS